MIFEILEDKLLYRKKGENRNIGRVLFDVKDGVMSVNSVVVSHEYRKQGHAKEMMKKIVDIAVEKGYKIIPNCPYSEHWIESNPEYEHLILKQNKKDSLE